MSVGGGGPPRVQHQHPVAQIDACLVGDFHRGSDDSGAFEGRADEALEGVEIERSPRRQRAGEPAVARERGAVFVERRVSEEVIGVRVGGDHPGDGEIREGRDARAEPPSELGAAAGVDDRDGIAPDHHARVAYRTEVRETRLLVRPRVDMNALGHLLESQRLRGAGGRAGCEHKRERKPPVRYGEHSTRHRAPGHSGTDVDRFGAVARWCRGWT